MQEEPIVRQIVAEDREAFGGLMNEYIQEYVKIEKTYPVIFNPEIGEVYWDEIWEKKENYITVVAELGGKLIGFGVGEIHWFGKIEKTYFEGDRRGEVWDLYIIPEYRSRGMGRLMLEELEKLFAERGCAHMVLNGVDMGNPRAGQLYKKLGYKEWNVKYYKRIK